VLSSAVPASRYLSTGFTDSVKVGLTWWWRTAAPDQILLCHRRHDRLSIHSS
jgi:hypothetical protein